MAQGRAVGRNLDIAHRPGTALQQTAIFTPARLS
jgi:hypothetical protein